LTIIHAIVQLKFWCPAAGSTEAQISNAGT